MSKENKELKKKREIIAAQIEKDYLSQKKKNRDEVPKYLFATRLDLYQKTFRNIVAVRDIIKPEELTEIFNSEEVHCTRRLQLMELKRH